MRRKFLPSVITFIAKIAFFTYVTYLLVSQQPVIDAKRQQKEDLISQLDHARQEEIQLRKDLEIADTQEYIERVARERLGFLRPDERVFIDIRK